VDRVNGPLTEKTGEKMDELRVDTPSPGVVRITIDRPERRNALSPEMIDDLIEVIDGFAAQSEARVLVVTGSGTIFCSGVDVSHRRDGGVTPAMELKDNLARHIQRLILTLHQIDKPTIAAINGAAAGGGLDLALVCDFRIASSSARFAESYVRLGRVPALGGCFLLPQLVGRSNALEMLLTGEFIGAERALSWGLVNRVVSDAELSEHAVDFARQLAGGPPLALQMIKRAVRRSDVGTLEDHLDFMGSNAATIQTSRDAAEGIAAFFEKRPPVFEGR
jgi:enoyl-CoA hydratase/carnithine racemase